MRDRDGMEWWGIRAYNFAQYCWTLNGSREESSTVLFWRDGPHNPFYPSAEVKQGGEDAELLREANDLLAEAHPSIDCDSDCGCGNYIWHNKTTDWLSRYSAAHPGASTEVKPQTESEEG
jgi:hypothetical protein